jgi:hypothetical protein
LGTVRTCKEPDSAKCEPAIENGCQYIVKAYYDEIIADMRLVKLPVNSKLSCAILSEEPKACTHEITARYIQLFSKADINSVSTCSVDLTTGSKICPVEIRAEFGPESKFYLINSAAGAAK